MLAIGGAALMTGAAVAIAGAVGFVGIVAPHLARPFVGHDPGRAILPAALIGGALLCLADIAVRLAPFDQELKLGVAAALFGAPAFIAIAAATRRIAR
jgi:iron complex transport system permease protein